MPKYDVTILDSETGQKETKHIGAVNMRDLLEYLALAYKACRILEIKEVPNESFI